MSDIQHANERIAAALETMAGASGGGLPAVTEADNGKVLMVVDGVWTAVALPASESDDAAPSDDDADPVSSDDDVDPVPADGDGT